MEKPARRRSRSRPDHDNIGLQLVRFAPVFLKRNLDEPSHVLVVGLGGSWRRIVMQMIVVAQDHPDRRPVFTFAVDKDEASRLNHWLAATPELDLVVDIVVLTRLAGEILPPDDAIAAWRAVHGVPQIALVLTEDGDAVATVLALHRPDNALGADGIPILVFRPPEGLSLSRSGETPLKCDMSDVTAKRGPVRPESIDRKGEEMAIALHARYLDVAKRRGAGSPAAWEAWDRLPENLRDANRAAVNHAPILFAAAGLHIVTAMPQADPIRLSDEELERLARVEHRHWMAARIGRGWRHGKTRDDGRMRHSDFVPYEALSEAKKDKDRNSVRSLLSLIAGQGYSFERTSQEL